MSTNLPTSQACTDDRHDHCPDAGMPAPLCLCDCHKSGLTTRTFSASGAGMSTDDTKGAQNATQGVSDDAVDLRDIIANADMATIADALEVIGRRVAELTKERS